MLPSLQAQERVATIDDLAYAQGAMKEEDATEHIQQLREIARRNKSAEARKNVAPRPKSMEEMMGLVGGASVAMQLVKGPQFEAMEKAEKEAQEAAVQT